MKLNIQTPEWAEEFLEHKRYKGAFGGRGCVHSSTKLNTPTGDIAISEFKGGDIYSHDSHGDVIITYAEAPIEYTIEDLYEVILESGESIIVTDEHKFYRYIGSWVMLKDLFVGDLIKTRGGLDPDDEDSFYPVWSKVISIKFHSREKYWDLHVPETECYFAEGILNHNTGKSHFFAELGVERMILDPGFKMVCIREVQQTLNHSVKALIENKIEFLKLSDYFEIQTSCIKSTKGDGIIIFQGMNNHNSDSIKSLEGFDVAFFEEAQSASQRSLDLLRPTMRKEGSELWFAWNPYKESDPIDRFLRGATPPPSSVVRKVTFEDNPWFPDVLKEEMEYDRDRDPDKFAHVWMGEYMQASEARVFKNWKVEEFQTPNDAIFRQGCDFGYAQDPSCLIRCFIEGRRLYFDQEAFGYNIEIEDLPDLYFQVDEVEKWPLVGDSSRPETISYLRNHGFPHIRSSVKGANSIHEGISFMKSYDIVIHPRCRHLIDEFENYSYKVDPLTEEILPVFADKKNHCIAEGEYVKCLRGLVKIEEVVVGDKVMTRGGFMPVLSSGRTGDDCETIIIKTISGKSIRLTGNHKILTRRGWLTAQDISYNDEILSTEELCPSQNQKSLMESGILGILSRTVKVLEITTEHAGQEKELRYFTGTFGNIIMGQYLRVCTFITLTSTLTIMISQTLSVLLPLSILKSIGMMTGRLGKLSTLIGLGHLQANGILAQKVLSGIKRMEKTIERISSQKRRIVKIVKQNLRRKKTTTQTDSAQTNASQPGGESQDWTMLLAYAGAVKENIESINIQRARLAVDRVQTITDGSKSRAVYDLTVDGLHEYECQGILVGNCIDSARYALEAVRRGGKAKIKDSFKPIPKVSHWKKSSKFRIIK